MAEQTTIWSELERIAAQAKQATMQVMAQNSDLMATVTLQQAEIEKLKAELAEAKKAKRKPAAKK